MISGGSAETSLESPHQELHYINRSRSAARCRAWRKRWDRLGIFAVVGVAAAESTPSLS